jgi:rare lipoprotein A
MPLRRDSRSVLAMMAVLSACQAEPAPPAAGQKSAGPAQTGVASYYARELAGEQTASGERLDPESMTAASRALPLGASARVTNTETGRSVTVEINDRGPYAKGRILDVTPAAAERLGFKDEGVAEVAVQPIADPEP